MSDSACRFWWPTTLAALGVTYLGCIKWWGALLSIAVLLWFAFPGVLVARRLTQSTTNRFHWLLGPVWGVVCSTLGLLVWWLLGFQKAWILIAAPWPLWLLLCCPLEKAGVLLPFPQLERRDVLALSFVLLIVPVVASMPYHHVAAPTEDGGTAYRAYFTADFVWAMTVVSEVSKGEVPPQNPFLRDSALPYYWLAHFLSAVEYRMFDPLGLSVEEVTLAGSVGFSVLFLLFLFGLMRAFGASPVASALACGLVFLANSFEVADRLWVWRNDPALVDALKSINVDAVTRWFYSGMPVDGLHRMILYQPHHLSGYARGLAALLIGARATDVARPFVALTAGLLLGASLLFSSVTAIIVGVAVAVVYAVRLLRPWQWRAAIVCAALGAAPVLLAVMVSNALRYVAPVEGPMVIVGPNPVALAHWPYALLLSFGPLLILGALGAVVGWRRRLQAWPIGVLALVALLFYFLTDVPDMQHVWVGWRAGHLLFIASAVFTALLLTAIGRAGPPRLAMGVAVALVAAPAVPTTVVDLYNAQDITNREDGPTFPWTLVLTRSETEALDWVKRRTSRTAVVQPDVRARDWASWGYMTAFGQRRMAAGLPIGMIPLSPYQEATDRVGERIFTSGPAHQRWQEAHQRGIDYLFVGPAEQRAHPELLEVLRQRPDLFLEACRNQPVGMFRVAGGILSPGG
ncbi:MAG: hypothetical protein ACKOEC_19910 [Acidimicrobiia bacterium]